MEYRTDDLRIKEIKELLPPSQVLRDIAISRKAAETVYQTRQAIHRILHGADDRLGDVLGPLFGGSERDNLFGGDGADSFYFAEMGSLHRDKIRDFDATDDTIMLDTGVFTQIATGTLAAGAFVNGTSAGDADDRIIYDNVSGTLWYDADGNGAGAQVIFAIVEPAVALTNLDFVGY